MASGSMYVAMELRESIDENRAMGHHRKGILQIPIMWETQRCMREQTICATWDCVELWSIDHRILFYRTVGGRRLAEILGIDPDKDLRQHLIDADLPISTYMPSPH